MRSATSLMIIGLVVFGVTALGAMGASSGMLAQSSTAVFTGAQTTVPDTPATLVKWNGGWHGGWHRGWRSYPYWGGSGYWGGSYYPYYNNYYRGNYWPNYQTQYCWFDGYRWDCSPS